jgi:glycosyltransferase involved in cell wall biosynthesis
MRLSVVVPVFNEAATVQEVLRDLRNRPFIDEVVCVDDGSTDGTADRLKALETAGEPGAPLVVIVQPVNQGKGAAVRRGFAAATGDAMVIFDADREYDPADLEAMRACLAEDRTAVVYGSRFLGRDRTAGSRLHYFGNRFLTGLTNLLFRGHLTDMETCLKMYHRRVLASLTLKADRFEIEPELAARTLKAGWPILELPVAYHPRTRAEGKKIAWHDGFKAVVMLVRCRFT